MVTDLFAVVRPVSHHWSNEDSILSIVVVALVGFSAFMAYAETALVRISKVRAAVMEEKGLHGSVVLRRLLEDPGGFLNPVLLVTLVCQLVAATLVGVIAANVFGGVGVAVATVFEVVVIFTVGEAIPKNLSVRNPDRAALRSAGLVSLIVRFPPIRALSGLVMGIARLITPGEGETSSVVSEEELLAMADAAVEGEVIETEERALIHSVISFGDTVAREVMVPRPDVISVSSTALVEEAVDIVLTAGYSRIPAFEGSVDNVVGVVYAKDLLGAERQGQRQVSVATLIRPAHFVPETKPVTDLLKEMQSGKFHLAIVFDEYGSTSGLVTLEDLIEELVGDINDEYDQEGPDLRPLGEGCYEVAGSYPVADLAEVLDVELPEGDWDSIAGMIMGILGRLPAQGEEVEVSGYRFVAELVTSRRIDLVRVAPLADGS
ncbi:MAG: hemolysin family protein [Acidimicrobiales bacterium]